MIRNRATGENDFATQVTFEGDDSNHVTRHAINKECSGDYKIFAGFAS